MLYNIFGEIKHLFLQTGEPHTGVDSGNFSVSQTPWKNSDTSNCSNCTLVINPSWFVQFGFGEFSPKKFAVRSTQRAQELPSEAQSKTWCGFVPFDVKLPELD
jgi:hypothetical protein